MSSMKTVAMIMAMSFMFVILPSGCGPKVVSTPPAVTTPAAVAPALTPTRVPVEKAWVQEWGKVLDGAKREGSVVVYLAAGGELRSTLGQAFRDKYGIRAEFVSGRGAEMGEKVPREQAAALYLGDVLVGATTAVMEKLKPGGYLDPLSPALILPEVVDPKVWWSGKLLWVDREERYTLAFLAFPSPPLAINTHLVKPDEIRSYRDLLDPKWKGKIVMNDPTVSGIGLVTFRVTTDRMGLDFMRELAKQEPTVIRDQRLVSEWLARGKNPIAIAADPTAAAPFIKAGSPVQFLTPSEGSHLTGGFGTVSLLHKAPHPDAAKLFINWLLSVEGQTVWSRTDSTHSARIDVAVDFINPELRRQQGINYFWTYREDWLLGQNEGIKQAKEIFGHLAK